MGCYVTRAHGLSGVTMCWPPGACSRARTFSVLDGLLLAFASVGPLVGATLVAKLGFWGAFAACSAVYATAACSFLLAPPSPQRAAKPSAACASWARASTPMLLCRMLRTRKLRWLCLAFILALGGSNGGAISLVFFGQRYLGWQQQQLGYFISAFSASGAFTIAFVHPTASCLLRRRVSDLTMTRCAYIGPVFYFSLLAFLPRLDVLPFALLPLFALAPCALPHFRALFSRAAPDEAQGEQMALIAALESLPQLYAAPLAGIAFNLFLHKPGVVLLGFALMPLTAMLILWVHVSDEQPPSSAALLHHAASPIPTAEGDPFTQHTNQAALLAPINDGDEETRRGCATRAESQRGA